MKLTLEHLAPYLPYGLKVLVEDYGIEQMIGVLDDEVITTEDNADLSTVKPILRPLSDLTKEIEHNGERFLPIERLRKEYSGFYFESNPELLIKSKNTNMYISLKWCCQFQQKLYKWHFDVFGLIEKGLAINMNDL